jgi:hypothetical protein
LEMFPLFQFLIRLNFSGDHSPSSAFFSMSSCTFYCF